MLRIPDGAKAGQPSAAAMASSSSAAGRRAEQQYRRDIDGLRAVAVLSVVLYHAQLKIAPGGFVGVDVFFVISGYLITGIIIRAKETKEFSLLGFYERRARRILPALYLMVGACIPAAWLLMMPYQLKDFAASVAAVAAFVSNFLFWRSTGYFAQAAAETPLLHTWTLAIEEQFYVFFPLLVIVLWPFGKRFLVLFIGAMLCASFLLSVWGSRHAPNANFFLMPTRAWELLLGALASCISPPSLNARLFLNNAISAAGLSLILYSVAFFNEHTPFPSAYALAPTLGAALIIIYATPHTMAGRILALGPFVGVGVISYSVYLWHYPLFAFSHIIMAEAPGPSLACALIIATLLLSYLSWRFVEMPFRNKATVSRPAVAKFAASGMAFLLALGGVAYFSNGLEKQFASRFGQEGAALNRAIATRGLEHLLDDSACRFWSVSADANFLARFERCARQGGQAYLVIGDSHAMDLYNALFQNSSYPFLVMLAKGGCRTQAPAANCPYEQIVELLRTHRASVKAALFTQKGSYFLKGHKYEVAEREVALTRQYLIRIAQFVPVVWFGPQIETGVDLLRLRKMHPARNRTPPQDIAMQQELIRVDRFIAEALRGETTIRYLSKIDAVRYDHAKDFVVDGEYTYSDVDHWSSFGERIFGARLVDYLRKTGFSEL